LTRWLFAQHAQDSSKRVGKSLTLHSRRLRPAPELLGFSFSDRTGKASGMGSWLLG